MSLGSPVHLRPYSPRPPVVYGHFQYGPSAPVPPYRAVQRSGISAAGHAVHITLTVCTFGAWGFVYFLHWLFTRNKSVTIYER